MRAFDLVRSSTQSSQRFRWMQTSMSSINSPPHKAGFSVTNDEEIAAAATAVDRVLAHPLFHRARAARADRCRREVPVTWRNGKGTIIEGFIDLAFRENGRWTIVDFKTDEEMRRAANYAAQVDLYAKAVRASTGEDTVGILMRI